LRLRASSSEEEGTASGITGGEAHAADLEANVDVELELVLKFVFELELVVEFVLELEFVLESVLELEFVLEFELDWFAAVTAATAAVAAVTVAAVTVAAAAAAVAAAAATAAFEGVFFFLAADADDPRFLYLGRMDGTAW